MPNEALVATLRLLCGAHGNSDVYAALHDATILPEHERDRLVCVECGSDDINFDGVCSWDATHGEMVVGNMERCWCEVCGEDTSDLKVAFDYVNPNKSLDETGDVTPRSK